MVRAYGVVLVFTIVLSAGVAAMFDFGNRHPDEWWIALVAFVILLGILFLLSIGPLRPSFERTGLGRHRDQGAFGVASSLAGPVFGIANGSVMRLVLGSNPGFAAMFAWLAVSFTVAFALYALVRRRLAPAQT